VGLQDAGGLAGARQGEGAQAGMGVYPLAREVGEGAETGDGNGDFMKTNRDWEAWVDWMWFGICVAACVVGFVMMLSGRLS